MRKIFGGNALSPEVRKKLKNILEIIMLGVLLGLFILAVVIDCTYWRFIDCTLAQNIINYLMILKKINITYHEAEKLIGGTIGILMTITNVFLNMSISMAQRSEVKVCGILRDELYRSQESWFYRGMKFWNYLALFFMFICLNISFCVSCYLLVTYSYMFLILHYCIHVRSYSKKRDRSKLLDQLLLPISALKSDKNMMEYQLLLETIGNAIQKEGVWKEAEFIFDTFFHKVSFKQEEDRFVICSLLYKYFFWGDSSRQIIGVHVLKKYIEDYEEFQVASEKEREKIKKTNLFSNEENWRLLWSMIYTMFSIADEKILVEFFRWFLAVEVRGAHMYSKTRKKIPTTVLYPEYEMCLIAMELRLRKETIKEKNLVLQLVRLWDLGENVFMLAGTGMGNKLAFLHYQVDDDIAELLSAIIQGLKEDYREGYGRTYTANVVRVGKEFNYGNL